MVEYNALHDMHASYYFGNPTVVKQMNKLTNVLLGYSLEPDQNKTTNILKHPPRYKNPTHKNKENPPKTPNNLKHKNPTIQHRPTPAIPIKTLLIQENPKNKTSIKIT